MSDESDAESPCTLFDDGIEPRFRTPPKQLFRADGWTVLDMLNSQRQNVRVLVQYGAKSLDQTRVKLTSDGQGFDRSRLFALSAQVGALMVALHLKQHSAQKLRICVLGGGGLALPLGLLHALPSSAKVIAVELDPVVIDLCRKFFGCIPAEESGQLQLLQLDALDYVTSGSAPKPCSCMIVDIDFLRGGICPKLLSVEFWRCVWECLGSSGLFVLNSLGGSPTDVAHVCGYAMTCAPANTRAGTFEPAGQAAETIWNEFRPRPSILVIGPVETLEPLLHPLTLQKSLRDADGLELMWAAPLCGDLLGELERAEGQAGSWRSVQVV